jgi:hypothetical protein
LRTYINLLEARRLTVLFEPNSSGKWYPLTQLSNLPKERRREMLFKFLDEMTGEI